MEKIEKKLKALFDYQRFAQDEKLAALIKDTESRYGISDDPVPLTDYDLSDLAAAGDIYSKDKNRTE